MTTIPVKDTTHPHSFDLETPIYRGDKFTWRGKSGTGEISDLVVPNCPLFKPPFKSHPQVRGFRVVSQLSGTVLEFVLVSVDQIGCWEDYEITGWRFRSKCGIEILVVND